MQGLRDEQNNDAIAAQKRLLFSLAESLRLPLLQVARQAELAQLSKRPKPILKNIELTADASLRLLDSYLLSLQLAHDPKTPLSQVSVATILDKTAGELQKQAGLYNCNVQIKISGRYEPVLVHPEALQSALVSLGLVFIEAQQPVGKQKPTIQLAAHRNNAGGIVAGIFSDADNLSSAMFHRAKQLYGKSRHPLSQMLSTSGAGVFIADSLLANMSTHLRVAHHHKRAGLAATLLSSRQLELV